MDFISPRDFKRRRTANAARLARVIRALAKWQEWETAQPATAEPSSDVRPPLLRRLALESLHEMLLSVLAEMDNMRERRN